MKKNPNPARLLNRGFLKMIIIKSMRGFDEHSAAIGENCCIREAVLVERIKKLIDKELPNELLCDLIKELRDLYSENPKKNKGSKVHYWDFEVIEPNGTQYFFKVFANEYICGGNHGRYFPANEKELKHYQNQRKVDYLTQLNNFKTAGKACKFFLQKQSNNQNLFS